MADYVNPQFESDPGTIERAIYDYIQTVFPDWEPRDAHVVKILSEAFSEQIGELIRLATDVPPAIFRYFGGLVGINPLDAIEATANVTITVLDNAGYTIPDGTGIRFLVGGDDYEAFVTVGDVVIPNTRATTLPGEVLLRAVNAGASASGLTTPPELTDVLDYVTGVTLVSPTHGGQDAEDDDTYLSRLSARLTLLADHPVVPDDFVIYAMTIPGVERCIAIDGFDPDTDTFNNDKMIAILALDSNGDPVGPAIESQILDLLVAARETNFTPKIAIPNYTSCNVVASVRALPGYDLTELDARVTAAVRAFIDPSNWGVHEVGDNTIFIMEDKVRISNVIRVIENVLGVNYVVPGSLTLQGVSSDLDLNTGDFAIPAFPARSSTVDITVVAA